MTSRILNSRAAPMLASVALLALLLPACQQGDSSASTPSAVQPTEPATSAPKQPVAAAPVLKELGTQALKMRLIQGRLCNIETVDGDKPTAEAAVPKDVGSVAFAGWIGDETTGRRADNARLLIQMLDRSRAWEQPVGDVILRKDVAKAMNIPTLEDGGFKVNVDLSELPVGEYRVLLVYANGEQNFVCDNGRRVMR